MKWNRLSRRHLLQGAGAALTLPLLTSLLPKTAQAAGSPKSFIGIGAWNGLYQMYGPNSLLMPPTPESNGTLPGFQPLAVPGCHTIYSGTLSKLAAANNGQISKVIDSSFTPLLSKMMMLQGFDYIGMGSSFHHSGHFGNWHKTAQETEGNSPMATLDNVISNYYAQNGLPSDVVTYSECYATNPTQYGCSFQADGTSTTSWFDNPAALWDKYFGNSKIPTDYKTLLVDKVLGDYNALRNNPRLGSADQKLLDAHIAHLAVTEAKVKQLAAVCQQLRPADNLTDRTMILQTLNSVFAGLISCGMCNIFMGWAPALVNNDPNQWHVWSHQGYNNNTSPGTINDATAYGSLVQQNSLVLKDQCLDLALKLDQLGQLDNSLIVCIQEHSMRGHETWNVPVITFGSAGGTFKTDQFVDFRDIANRDDVQFTRFGFPMNQLYANVLQAMGVPPSTYEPLNKGRSDAVCPFKANSGYGVPGIHPDSTQMMPHYAGWTGYDMSGWLPLIKA
jgi:hypothetical protein